MKQLEGMIFDLEFSRKITEEELKALSAGGFELSNGKRFDFTEETKNLLPVSSGKIVHFHLNGFDKAYASEYGIDSITEEDLAKEVFDEFYVYVDKVKEPLYPKKIRYLSFYFSQSVVPSVTQATVKQLDSINEYFKNELRDD